MNTPSSYAPPWSLAYRASNAPSPWHPLGQPSAAKPDPDLPLARPRSVGDAHLFSLQNDPRFANESLETLRLLTQAMPPEQLIISNQQHPNQLQKKQHPYGSYKETVAQGAKLGALFSLVPILTVLPWQLWKHKNKSEPMKTITEVAFHELKSIHHAIQDSLQSRFAGYKTMVQSLKKAKEALWPPSPSDASPSWLERQEAQSPKLVGSLKGMGEFLVYGTAGGTLISSEMYRSEGNKLKKELESPKEPKEAESPNALQGLLPNAKASPFWHGFWMSLIFENVQDILPMFVIWAIAQATPHRKKANAVVKKVGLHPAFIGLTIMEPLLGGTVALKLDNQRRANKEKKSPPTNASPPDNGA